MAGDWNNDWNNDWGATVFTEIVRYVNTASTAGGDGTTNATTGANRAYASLTEWEAAEQKDLVAVAETHTVLCSGTAADTALCVVSGWTTDATSYITIKGNPGTVDGRNFGRKYSSSHYRLEFSGFGRTLHILQAFTRVVGIQANGQSSNTPVIEIGALDCVVEGCKIDMLSGSAIRGIGAAAAAGRLCARNNLICGVSVGEGINSAATLDIYVFNNTMDDCNRGLNAVVAGGIVAKNNLVINCTTSYLGTYDAASDFNSTDNAETTGGANDRQSQTFSFVDSGGGDFGLTEDDTGALDVGVDLSADVNCPVNLDNIDTKRPKNSLFDIGCFELIVIIDGNGYGYGLGEGLGIGLGLGLGSSYE